MWILSNLQGQRITDITSQTGIIACLFEDMIDKARRRRLTIRTCNTDHLRMGIATGKLYLTDDMNTFLLNLYNHRGRIGNTRTLNDLVGIQNLFFRMVTFFPTYLVVIHQLLILIINLRHVTYKHVEALFLGQNGSSCSALSGS